MKVSTQRSRSNSPIKRPNHANEANEPTKSLHDLISDSDITSTQGPVSLTNLRSTSESEASSLQTIVIADNDRFQQTLTEVSTVFGSISRVDADMQVLSASRWFVKKKCEEYDAKILAYYNGQLKSMNKYIRNMNDRMNAIINKLSSLMRWSSLSQPFQALVLDYCQHISTSIIEGSAESQLQSKFNALHGRKPDSVSDSSKATTKKVHPATSSKFLQSKLKWHEQLHQKWLHEQEEARKVEEAKKAAKEEKIHGKSSTNDQSNQIELTIDDDFPEKKKLESWFLHYQGSESDKVVHDIKVSISKLTDLLFTRRDYCRRLEEETLKSIEVMVIKKESDLRWTAETNKDLSMHHHKNSMPIAEEPAKKPTHTTLTYARDKYWSIWFLSSRGLNEQLRRYLSNPKNAANINMRDPDFGMTALHYASKANKLEAVTMLLEYNADVHIGTPDGRTALHLAAAYCTRLGSKELMLKLLGNGNPDYYLQKDNYGFMPIDLAIQNQNKAAMELLGSWKYLLDVQFARALPFP
jgi:hypothetical protein